MLDATSADVVAGIRWEGPIGRRGTSQALDFNNAIFDNIFLFQSEFIKALELSPDSL